MILCRRVNSAAIQQEEYFPEKRLPSWRASAFGGPDLRTIYGIQYISKIIIITIKNRVPYDQVVRPEQTIRVIKHNELQHAGSSRGDE